METIRKNKKNENDEILKSYLNQVRKIPLLTFDEELELSRKIKNGDNAALHRLIEANLRLVIKIARTYLANETSLMDLIQEGNIGLMKAAEKYDHHKELRFSTYAAWWIRQSISRYLSDKMRIIRLPERKEVMFRKIRQAYNDLYQTNLRKPRAEEIAAEIGSSKGEVELILNLSHVAISLETVGKNYKGNSELEFLEDHTYNPEHALLRKSSQEAALGVLDHLKDREKNILIYRYQLNGEKRHTLKNISDKMGLSRETVRNIEFRALGKLRQHADELKIFVGAV